MTLTHTFKTTFPIVDLLRCLLRETLLTTQQLPLGEVSVTELIKPPKMDGHGAGRRRVASYKPKTVFRSDMLTFQLTPRRQLPGDRLHFG